MLEQERCSCSVLNDTPGPAILRTGASATGPLTVRDADGARIAAPGSVFDTQTGVVTYGVDPPAHVVATVIDPSTSAVYLTAPTGTPQRIELRGTAAGLPWQPRDDLREVGRTFRIPRPTAPLPIPVAGASTLQLRTVGRRTWVERSARGWSRKETHRRVVELAPGSRSALVAVSSDVLIGRFADRPRTRMIRRFDADVPWKNTAGHRAPRSSTQVVAGGAGSVAWIEDDVLTVLAYRDHGNDPSTWSTRTVAAPGASALALDDGVVYWTDASGRVTVADLDGDGPLRPRRVS